MGFFSWKTSDTEETIANVHTGRSKTVFLLQPGDQPNIREDEYEGYGVFGGLDAHIWLVKANAESLGIDTSEMTDEQVRHLGIAMFVGSVKEDTETGEIWHIMQDCRCLIPGKFFPGNYAELIPELGASANELSDSGRFKTREIKDLVEIPYPLKFSFDVNATYEDLPAAQDCPNQGFFFDEDEDEDDD